MIVKRSDRPVSWTAQGVATARAAEALQPPPRQLLDDPYSRHFVRDPALRACLIHPLVSRAFIEFINRVFVGNHSYIVLRARYIDDIWGAGVDGGLEQLLLLGAGFDTTCIRKPKGDAATVFEVDASATQEHKRRVVKRLSHGRDNDRVVWVACDFEQDDLQERLLANGFDPARRTLVIWAGVLIYLTRPAITTTLKALATVCPAGSQLVIDYVDADALNGNTTSVGARRAAWLAARRGEPFRTGFTPADIDMLLATNGFESEEHVSLSALLDRYDQIDRRRPVGGDWQTIVAAKRTRAI